MTISNYIVPLKSILTSLVVILCPFISFSQDIIGTTTPVAGADITYSITDDIIYTNPNWSADNGYVGSSSSNVFTYTAQIRFQSPGPATVYFKNGSIVIATLSVTVACPNVPVPNATFSYTNNCGNTVVTRIGAPPSAINWYWQNSPNGTTTTQPGTTYTVTSASTYYLTAQSNTAPNCWSTGQATSPVTIISPVVSNAGPDQTVCGLAPVTLAGNIPSRGTGSWSVITGTGGTFGNSSSPTSTFSGTEGVTYLLRWTIVNSPCADASDDVIITFKGAPTISNAGPDQTSSATCGLTTVTLGANIPTVGTGSWSLISGTGGVIANTSSSSSTFSGIAGSTYTLRWTITNSPCAASIDDVVITFIRNPTVSNAGADQTGSATCGLTSVTLGANTPAIGTGSWSVISGAGGTFGNIASPSSTFSGIAGSTYTLRWTIVNSPCTSSVDDVVIAFNRSPTASNAGADQTSSTTCGLTSVTLAANTPSIGAGSWSIVSGTGGSFGNVTSPLSIFTGIAGSTYTLRWTISNSPCSASVDDVVVSFNRTPTTSNAGADQIGLTTCGLTSVSLAANTPAIGMGSWSVVSGTGGTIANASSPNSIFSGAVGSTYTLRWTISNSPCAASVDDVIILFNRAPTTSNAGLDQTGLTTCGLTSVTLGANTPTIGTGSWSVVSGTGGALGNASNPASSFSGISGSTYTLRWTITNSPCLVSTDDVNITFSQIPVAPTVTGNTRFGTGAVTLTGNGTPVSGTYKWYNSANVYQNSALTYPIASVSVSAINYMFVKSVSAAGCEGPQTAININVYAQPVVSAQQNYVTKEVPVALTATAGNDTYTWKNSANTTVASSQIFNATLPDTYTVTVTKTGATSAAVPYTLNGPLYGVNMNYVVSNNVLIPNITDPMKVPNLAADKVTQTITYFDGLGRPIQNVATQASSLKSDIVTPVKYDLYGRQTREYLPYVAENNGRYKNADLTTQASFYNTTPPYNNKIKTDLAPWAETVFDNSPLNRVTQKGAPGTVWQPNTTTPANAKAIKMEYLVNVDGTAANQEKIKIWTLTAVTLNSKPEFILTSTAFYPSNTLYVNVTKDEENRQVREYTDKLGKVILKKVQDVTTPAINVDTDWTHTYYIYDEFERLRFVLQPKFIFRTSNYNAYAANQDKKNMLDSLSFEYRYDERGRMIYKRVPGAKQVDIVYDQWDRLVLSQDGNQKAATRWSFTKYDVFNRPIITGEIASANTRDAMVTAVNAITNRSENTASGNGVGYTLNLTYPTTTTINDIYTITYYDDYTFKTNLALGTAYDAAIPSGFSGIASSRVKNLVTGSKIRVLQSSPVQWLINANYYDDRYRLIHSVSDDHLNNKNRITNEYFGLTAWITKSQLSHGTALTSLTETTYDHMGRVKEVWQTMDNLPATRTLIASHKYNELGELVEKNIHSTDNGVSFLQSIDYRYNIRGWLTNINNSALNNDGTMNDDANDLFGMELKYNDVVSINSVNTTAQFNGNISSIQWKTSNLVDATTEKVYGFTYDPLNRLKDATYATRNGSLWNANVNLFDENMTYDKNGNIRSLKRKSLHNSTNNALVDDLKYYYKGNQLDAVADNTAATYKPYGFVDGMTVTTGEYTYDANGSMEVDQNKGIVGTAGDTKGVLYNHLNLPREVRLGSKKIVYSYDAAGTKLRKIAYDNSGTEIARTDYIGGIQYESNVLKFMMTAEGRVVKNGTTWQYEYFHKDHLGNNRVVFGYQKQVDEYKATMESPTPIASKEQGQFYNLTTTRVTALNHTIASIDVVAPDKSAETNGYITGKSIGPAKMLQVAAGDRVQLEVFARYQTGIGTNTTLITNLASAVTGSFMLTAGEAAHTALTNSVPVQAASITRASGVPKAYLFYILFNSSYVYQQFGYVQVNSTALVGHQQLYLDITVPTGGYLYTYVANESKVGNSSSVYFDDFSIIHTRNTNALQVVQTTDYYPFGLAMAAQSYQKQSSLDNDYLYNGKELQDEHNLGWMDYGARMYVPEIGRFFLHDRYSEKYLNLSPYQYVSNNPIYYVDINGDSIVSIARKDNSIIIVNSPLEEGGTNFINTIRLDVQQNEVTDYSAGIINDSMVKIGDNEVLITSAYRSPEEQAEIMYENLEDGSVEGEKETYGDSGDKVIDKYSELKKFNGRYTPSNMKLIMEAIIVNVGADKVSKHSSNPKTYNVIDIAPSTVSDLKSFHQAFIDDNRRVDKVLSQINKPAEKAVHIEISQKKK